MFIRVPGGFFCVKNMADRSGKKPPAYHFHRHILPGPDAEGGSALIQKHIHAVLYAAATLLGFTKQPGLGRMVDHLGHDPIGAEQGRIP